MADHTSTLQDALQKFPTLRELPEGKKFRYASDHNKITFLKCVQPDTGLQSHNYLPLSEWGIYAVIIDNNGDTHPAVAVGKVVCLNDGVLVREVE